MNPDSAVLDPRKKSLVPMAVALARGEKLPASWARQLLADAAKAAAQTRARQIDVKSEVEARAADAAAIGEFHRRLAICDWGPYVETRLRESDAGPQVLSMHSGWIAAAECDWRVYTVQPAFRDWYNQMTLTGGTVRYSRPAGLVVTYMTGDPYCDLTALLKRVKNTERNVRREAADIVAALATDWLAQSVEQLVKAADDAAANPHARRLAAAAITDKLADQLRAVIRADDQQQLQEQRERSLAGQRRGEAGRLAPALEADVLSKAGPGRANWPLKVRMTADGAELLAVCSFDGKAVYRQRNPRPDLAAELARYFVTVTEPELPQNA